MPGRSDQHLLELRSEMLASRLRGRIDSLAASLRPPGRRQLFTTQVDRREALAWWRKHKDDEYGQKAIRQMDPIAVMDLERNLAAADADEAEESYYDEEGD